MGEKYRIAASARLFRMLDRAGFITGAWTGLPLDDLPSEKVVEFKECLREWLNSLLQQ